MADHNTYSEYVTKDEEIQAYKKDSNSVVTFNIVYDLDNIGKDKCLTFKPVMSHQIFGENECIFGYRSLAIALYYLHNSSRCYVDIKSGRQIDSSLHKPDDIMESLNPWLPENYVSKEKEFINMFKTETHDLIHGKILHEFKDNKKCELFPNDEVYCTYKIAQCDFRNEEFKLFHTRFETFVIWYIDGAKFIDLDDEKWEIFYVYEEIKRPNNEQVYITPIGYCTVYKFFAYPENIRSRISQFFILPSHQRRGVGTVLYNVVYKELVSRDEVTDITVEEPTSNFQRIRDIHDSSLLKKTLLENKMSALVTHPKKIFNVLKTLKIGKKQSQRVFDILCGFEALSNKETYNSYLRNLKKRIETETHEKMRGFKKMLANENGDSGYTRELTDEGTVIQAEYKRYKEDLEISIEYLKKALQASS